MRRVYFDHNATTSVDPEVLRAMLPYFSDEFGNASSIHSFGQRTRAAVERARESVAALIGARPTEIVFTSGGTESDNLAILGVAAAAASKASRGKRPHVIATSIEHHAVLNACQALEQRGADVTFLPVDGEGRVDPGDARRRGARARIGGSADRGAPHGNCLHQWRHGIGQSGDFRIGRGCRG